MFHPFFVLCLWAALPGWAQRLRIEPSPASQKAYAQVLELDLAQGRSLATQALQKQPDNLMPLLQENLADFLELMLNEDPQRYLKLVGNERKRLRRLESTEPASPWYRLAQAEVEFQWGLVKLRMGHQWSGLLNIRSAYKLLKENQEIYPQFVPTYKTLGCIELLIGTAPQDYSFIISMLGLGGTTAEGLAHLELASRQPGPAGLDARLLRELCRVYVLPKSTQTLDSMQVLFKAYPENPLVNYLMASCLMHENRSVEAWPLLDKVARRKEGLNLSLVPFLQGEIRLQEGEYEQAERHYQQFLKGHKGENSLKDACFKLALTHYLRGDTKKATYWMGQIRQRGEAITVGDKYAQRMSEKRRWANPKLTKIRLHTDGGFFNKAYAQLEGLEESDFTTLEDKLEYHYRKARLYHQSGKPERAIAVYQTVIQMSIPDPGLYFAPNSALQLAYIYQSKGETELARQHFQKALSYKKHEYKNSIDQKAQAGLQSLR